MWEINILLELKYHITRGHKYSDKDINVSHSCDQVSKLMYFNRILMYVYPCTLSGCFILMIGCWTAQHNLIMYYEIWMSYFMIHYHFRRFWPLIIYLKITTFITSVILHYVYYLILQRFIKQISLSPWTLCYVPGPISLEPNHGGTNILTSELLS